MQCVNPKEPLITVTELPERPWQKQGADFFMLKNRTYLLVVDYYSRHVEIHRDDNFKKKKTVLGNPALLEV